jgi:GntR family transcriptional regulator
MPKLISRVNRLTRGAEGEEKGFAAVRLGAPCDRNPVLTMLLSIDPDGPVPIYQQIRDRIVEAIADGTLPAGSGLPSVRQLAVALGINLHTVSKSYDVLRQEGLLRINHKSGAVVKRDPASGPPGPGSIPDWDARLRTLLAEAAAQGLPAEIITAHCQAALAGFAFPLAQEQS